MKKIKLESTYSIDDVIILGISTPMSDYKLVWHINEGRNFNFVKTEDFSFLPLKQEEFVNFPFYNYEDKEQYKNFFLVANRSGSQFLIPEFKSFDYLLFIKGNTKQEEINLLINYFKKISNVALVINIDLKKIKALDIILNDLEMFKLSLKISNDVRSS